MDSSLVVQFLEKEKEKLERALSECASISKEMEEYYMGQIEMLRQQLEEQKNVIVRL